MSTHSLRWDLSGRFEHPHWLAHVSGGLADLGISVVTGHAVRRVAGSWEAYLVVDVSGSVVPASDVDVAALAAAPPGPQRAVPLRLSAVSVRRRPDGFLEVEVSAVDELGFLGRLLRRVALLGLHPVEVTVATRNGVVHDRLVLAGIGSKVPSEEIAALVEQVLDGLVVR
jgi:hypothetical protein